jgi:hypothetical protein
MSLLLTSFLYYLPSDKKIEKIHTLRFSGVQFTLFPSVIAEQGFRRVPGTEDWRGFKRYASKLEFSLSGTTDSTESLACADDLVATICQLISFDTEIQWGMPIRLKAEGAVHAVTEFFEPSQERSDADRLISRYIEQDLLHKYAPLYEVIYAYLSAQRSPLLLSYLGFCRALEGLFPGVHKKYGKQFERALVKDPEFLTIFDRITTGPMSGFYGYRQVSPGLEIKSMKEMTHNIIVLRDSLAAHFGNPHLPLREKTERIRSYRLFLSALIREGIYSRCWGNEEPDFRFR